MTFFVLFYYFILWGKTKTQTQEVRTTHQHKTEKTEKKKMSVEHVSVVDKDGDRRLFERLYGEAVEQRRDDELFEQLVRWPTETLEVVKSSKNHRSTAYTKPDNKSNRQIAPFIEDSLAYFADKTRTILRRANNFEADAPLELSLLFDHDLEHRDELLAEAEQSNESATTTPTRADSPVQTRRGSSTRRRKDSGSSSSFGATPSRRASGENVLVMLGRGRQEAHESKDRPFATLLESHLKPVSTRQRGVHLAAIAERGLSLPRLAQPTFE